MADPTVELLVQRVVQFVEHDTGRRCRARTDELLAGLSPTEEHLLDRLANNLDVPARLAPSRSAVLARDPWQLDPDDTEPADDAFEEAYDERPAIRVLLTEMVARAANRLEPQGSVPESADQEQRDRLGWAVSRAYAESAVSELPRHVFTNGRRDDLGVFAQPVLEGDVSAARALAFAVGVRFSQTDKDVLRELVAAGRGAVAPTVAGKLLDRDPGFATLPGGRQQEAVVRLAAQRLEANFASRDPREARERELTEIVENRRDDIAGGATSVDEMNSWATDQVHKLHEFLAQHPGTEASPYAPDRAANLYEQAQRIQLAVHELTGTQQSLWDGDVPSPETVGRQTEYALRLTQDEALAVRDLTADGTDGPLSPERAATASQGIQKIATQYVRLAVPYGYNGRNEAAADSVAPRFIALQNAVANALAEDHLDDIIERTVPAQAAEQLRTTEPAYRDSEYAPAARAFAQAVDAAKGTEFPNETLRRMAGQGRAGIAMAAAHRLVSGSGVSPHEQPFAARIIADTIDQYFDDLPEQVERWRGGGYTGLAAQEVNDGAGYGEYLARLSLEIVKTYEESPGDAQRDSAEADRKAGRQSAAARFAPGHDPAATTFASVKIPTPAPDANGRTATDQSGKTLDR
ncbi:hypothetical protein [Kribbella kalugense]|uniref:Uncharacterized protein n=1 Tax=Kribbella kalugense TaxID=2512221 RepID=A0A4R7ZDB6_9ACTN|nr:hypothetical protein [Kribbella kalugense]TDW15212.1 hypothetical protein EV650_6694 [Kribbella kalugense]